MKMNLDSMQIELLKKGAEELGLTLSEYLLYLIYRDLPSVIVSDNNF